MTLKRYLLVWAFLGAVLAMYWYFLGAMGMPELLRCVLLATLLYPPRGLRTIEQRLWRRP